MTRGVISSDTRTRHVTPWSCLKEVSLHGLSLRHCAYHLAHTTWFWETFLLRDRLEGYTLFDERWPFVFNSYYEAEGEIGRAHV